MNVARCLPKVLTYTSKNNIISRGYAFKSDLKIKWVRPVKIPCYKPEKSGDLQPIQQIDQQELQVKFRNCKELEDADDLVKRLFTLEFAPHNRTVEAYINNLKVNVQRHPLDNNSIEAKLARWTGAIRTMQEIMDKYPKNKKLKVLLKELIDKRKKHLKYLRRWDYKRFEWLIDNLDIVYKPPPNEFHWITRKESLRKLTKIYCTQTVQGKLDDYKIVLQAQQPAFLEGKISSLEFIRSEQEKCGTPITITEEEINIVKQQLANLLKEREVSVKDD